MNVSQDLIPAQKGVGCVADVQNRAKPPGNIPDGAIRTGAFLVR
jgi:hypothetical protein